MLNYLNKPHKILFITSIFCILIGIIGHFFLGDGAFDIQDKNTSYDLDSALILNLMAIFNIFTAYLYWQKQQVNFIKTLTILHTLLSVLSMFTVLIGFYFLSTVTPKEIGCIAYIFHSALWWQTNFIAIIIFATAQILFILNLIISSRKHKKLER